jgi:hypothetical protein
MSFAEQHVKSLTKAKFSQKNKKKEWEDKLAKITWLKLETKTPKKVHKILRQIYLQHAHFT